MSERCTYNCHLINECCPSGVDKSLFKDDFLQRIIDGQASAREEALFYTAVDKCMDCTCKSNCLEELAIKNILKKTLERKKVPVGLADSIRRSVTGSI